MYETSILETGVIEASVYGASMYDYAFALCMLAVSFALVVWFRRELATGSERRMMGMMNQLGLGTEIVAKGDSGSKALMQEVRKRCSKCTAEDYCERWLNREVEGENSFCPNAQTFNAYLKGVR